MNNIDLTRLAQLVALQQPLPRPSYIQPGFEPHDWVVKAMEAAYAAGWEAKEEQMADTGMGDG